MNRDDQRIVLRCDLHGAASQELSSVKARMDEFAHALQRDSAENDFSNRHAACRSETQLAVKPGPSAVNSDRAGSPFARACSSTNNTVGGLLTCSRAQLFRFLAAVTSPEARTGPEQHELAQKIDALLRHDGYALGLAGRISGSPFYAVRPVPVGSPADERISAALAAFDPTQVHARWTAAMERRGSEPAGAITLARTLLEDVCKWILDQAQETWQEADDLPVLYRKLAKVLKLAPDDHTEQVFKQILGSCQSVVESLGALRNKLSDAHSPGPKRARPQGRHAELAVNLAGAMATFLVATWEARQAETGVRQPLVSTSGKGEQ